MLRVLSIVVLVIIASDSWSQESDLLCEGKDVDGLKVSFITNIDKSTDKIVVKLDGKLLINDKFEDRGNAYNVTVTEADGSTIIRFFDLNRTSLEFMIASNHEEGWYAKGVCSLNVKPRI